MMLASAPALVDFASAPPAILVQENVAVTQTPEGTLVTFPTGRLGRILFAVPKDADPGGIAIRFRKVAGPDNWNPYLLGDGAKPLIEGGGWISSGEHLWLMYGGRAQPNAKGLGYNPPTDVPGLEPISIPGSFQQHQQIDRFGFHISYPSQPVTLLFVRAYGYPVPAYAGVVDRWGQAAKASWPSKIRSDQELKQRLAREEAEIAQSPRMPDVDKFGGWTGGPQLESTGKWRTVKLDGKWWIVTPTGRLFYTMGVNNFTFEETTLTAGRRDMFEWLPEPGDELARYYGKSGGVVAGIQPEGSETFDFAGANHHRMWGPNWREPLMDLTERRMWHWGLNTLANWTDAPLVQRGNVPYTATTSVWGPSRTLNGAPDPFDPRFEEALRNDIARVQPFAKNDPMCMGVFVDNEINWGSGGAGPGRIFYFSAAIGAGAEVPAKRRLRAMFEDQYGDIQKLNSAWGTAFKDWDEVGAKQWQLSDEQLASPTLYQDAVQYSRAIYRQYFRTVRRVLNEMLPGTLYLGPRFHAWTPDAAEIAADYCDIVSFNVYSPTLSEQWQPAPNWDAPALIGEFGFRGRETGYFNRVGSDGRTEKDRAERLAAFWESVLDKPYMVGLHWFRYRDQHLLGRVFDGENAAFGLVTITNTPYPEMTQMVRRLTSRLYTDRFSRKN